MVTGAVVAVIDAVGAVFDVLPAGAVFAIDIAGLVTSLLLLYSLSLMFFLLLLV